MSRLRGRLSLLRPAFRCSERVRAALDDGVFHPTLLDEETAGCSHCEFAHVCDVRHHHRQARLEGLGDAPAYGPAKKLPVNLLGVKP